MSVKELLEELDGKVSHFRDELSHLVSWQKFERAGAVVTELEQELELLGLPVGPVEALTQSVLDVARAVHDHLTAGQAAQDREDIEAQIAELQAKLGDAPAPAPAGPLVDIDKIKAEIEARDAKASTSTAAVPTFQEPAAGGKKAGDGGA